jgi:hypothetical protein
LSTFKLAFQVHKFYGQSHILASWPDLKNRAWSALLLGVLLVLQVACAALSKSDQTAPMLALAQTRQFDRSQLAARGFELTTWSRRNGTATDILNLYIEGDGAPWPTPYLPPRDPTPLSPLALGLALADPAPAVIYLGRPCQYLTAQALARCDVLYWTERRFAPEVIAAYDEVLNQLKISQEVRGFRIIGYSGGGVIATLLAQRRNDIHLLITVASPLALSAWQEWHAATPLRGSLDPLLGQLPQAPGVHFGGAQDTIVPVAIAARFVSAKGGNLQTIAKFDHVCCWADNWPELLRFALSQEILN